MQVFWLKALAKVPAIHEYGLLGVEVNTPSGDASLRPMSCPS